MTLRQSSVNAHLTRRCPNNLSFKNIVSFLQKILIQEYFELRFFYLWMFSHHKLSTVSMSLFKKIFGTGNEASPRDEKDRDQHSLSIDGTLPIDEQFTFNFKKNGGKFLYCENLDEVREQFENILEENDWFESDAVCYEKNLFSLLDENKLNYTNPVEPKFLFATCENL